MGTISLLIPQINSPNSTEDVKVASDFTTLQTLLNGNVDTNNLKAAAGIKAAQLASGASFPNRVLTQTGDYNAQPGDFVIAENALTVFLASPTIGSSIAVFSATAANVQIHTLAGQILFGSLGFQSAGTLTGLGKCWTFMSDGSNWLLLTTTGSF